MGKDEPRREREEEERVDEPIGEKRILWKVRAAKANQPSVTRVKLISFNTVVAAGCLLCMQSLGLSLFSVKKHPYITYYPCAYI